MRDDGGCPNCGVSLPVAGAGGEAGAPWHFKLLAVGVVAYLGWRAVEVVLWLVSRL